MVFNMALLNMFSLTKLFNILLFILLPFSSQQAFAKFVELESFGSNPGELTASYFSESTKNKNLIVLLHGCVQSGETLAVQSGLLKLAKVNKFALLIPQQSSKNNIKSCFNWFHDQDTNKDSGETLSIMNMIKTLKHQQHSEKTYILGLSAGGAMTSSLIVHYPELFDGGAIIAGIPYPCANNLIKAISCMRSGPSQSVKTLVEEIHKLNANNINWPKLSIWTGNKDTIVNPLNSQHLAQSWAQLSGIKKQGIKVAQEGYQKTQWKDAQNNVQVELIELNNIGHGMTINSKQPNGGIAAKFLPDSPLSAAINIIKFWQLTPKS